MSKSIYLLPIPNFERPSQRQAAADALLLETYSEEARRGIYAQLQVSNGVVVAGPARGETDIRTGGGIAN